MRELCRALIKWLRSLQNHCLGRNNEDVGVGVVMNEPPPPFMHLDINLGCPRTAVSGQHHQLYLPNRSERMVRGSAPRLNVPHSHKEDDEPIHQWRSNPWLSDKGEDSKAQTLPRIKSNLTIKSARVLGLTHQLYTDTFNMKASPSASSLVIRNLWIGAGGTGSWQSTPTPLPHAYCTSFTYCPSTASTLLITFSWPSLFSLSKRSTICQERGTSLLILVFVLFISSCFKPYLVISPLSFSLWSYFWVLRYLRFLRYRDF